MKRSNLLFFMEQIVDLSIANQSLCDDRRGYEARIKKLEEHNTLLKERLEKDELSYLDATQAAFKRYIDAEGIRPNERFSKVVKQLQMYLPIDPKVFHTNDITDVSTTPEMVSKDTNEVYGEGPDYSPEFTLHNVEYLEDSRGYFKSADKIMHPGKHIEISHQEYVDSLNQYLKTQE